MIVAVCGDGYCGSSAVTDYLKDNGSMATNKYDIEFMFLYDVDGIDDLRHHIVERPNRYYSSDAAIKRYNKYINSLCSPRSDINRFVGKELKRKTSEYLSRITQLRWHGWWHFDFRFANIFVKNYNFRILSKVNYITKRFANYEINIYKNGVINYAYDSGMFDNITLEYVSNLVKLFNPSNKPNVVLDQPFPVGTGDYYKKYFTDEVRIINILRDPRDVYLAARVVNKADSTWIPTQNVEDYVVYYKKLYVHEKTYGKNELTINFEDLIYNYNATADKIDEFLSTKTPRIMSAFNPRVSINNTQLFNRYLDYKEDIAYIEQELSEYLYDFPDVDYSNFDGEAF